MEMGHRDEDGAGMRRWHRDGDGVQKWGWAQRWGGSKEMGRGHRVEDTAQQ